VTDKIRYGGDHDPEQGAEGIDTLTAGVFVWSLTQPAEDIYDFTVLDDILGRAADDGRSVCLGTGTAALPPWLVERYPEASRTDFEGRRHRHDFCPNSPQYRRLSTAVAARLAERYGTHPALLAWHVDNEYGGACYCDLCAEAFREWLRARHGTLDALNDAFWSHRYTDWAEIEPPTALTEPWRGLDHTPSQGITLDYRRFMTDALLGCFTAQKAAIREHGPETPVTTNMTGAHQPLSRATCRSDEWDSRPPEVVRPVVLPDGPEARAPLVFEIVKRTTLSSRTQ